MLEENPSQFNDVHQLIKQELPKMMFDTWLYKDLLKKLLGLSLLLFLTTGCSAYQSQAKAQEFLSQQEVVSGLQELYQRMEQAHYNLFANKTKQQFDEHYNKLKNSINSPLTRRETILLYQKFISFNDIAHARIDLPNEEYQAYRKAGGKTFPLYVKVIDGNFIVTENYSDNKSISVGDQIISIQGIEAYQLLSRLRYYKSADTDYMFYGFLEFELPMLLWFELGSLPSFTVQIKKTNEDVKTFAVQAVSHADLIAKANAQKGLLELGWERRSEVLANNIGYLRPGPFFNIEEGATDVWDNTSFASFVEDAFADFDKQSVKALLIDLRNNPGGDNSFSDLMIKQFATREFAFASEFYVKVSEEFIASNEQRISQSKSDAKDSISHQFKEKYLALKTGEKFLMPISKVKPIDKPFDKPVFILINRHSYSNAVTVAAMVKDYNFATIIGEQTSDLATTYGAMEQFTLQHTGIKVGFPKAYIIRPSGSLIRAGVKPDIVIQTPLVEYSEDKVLQRTLQKIAESMN